MLRSLYVYRRSTHDVTSGKARAKYARRQVDYLRALRGQHWDPTVPTMRSYMHQLQVCGADWEDTPRLTTTACSTDGYHSIKRRVAVHLQAFTALRLCCTTLTRGLTCPRERTSDMHATPQAPAIALGNILYWVCRLVCIHQGGLMMRCTLINSISGLNFSIKSASADLQPPRGMQLHVGKLEKRMCKCKMTYGIDRQKYVSPHDEMRR